ncbi:hypothetical protein EV360DRAFT_6117, partial [Lentinula raphanica]
IMLSSVCNSWRKVCLEAPSLWRRIGPNAHNYHLITLLLERSRDSPLIISYHEQGMGKRILPLLAQHCERWEDVSFIIPTSCFSLLSSIKGRLPLLKSLTWGLLRSDSELDSAEDFPGFSGFEIAPVLQQSQFLFPCPEKLITIPWTQLTDLTCGQVGTFGLYALLRHTPNICRLSLLVVLDDSAIQDPSSENTLTKLTTLSVME